MAIDLSAALKDDTQANTKVDTKDTKDSPTSSTIDLSSELQKSAPTPQSSERQGIQGPVAGSVSRVTEGSQQIRESIGPRKQEPTNYGPVDTLQGIFSPESAARVWGLIKGAGEIASAPFYPANYAGQRAGQYLTEHSGEMTDKALDVRIAKARQLKSGPAAGASVEVNELPMLERLRAMPYEQRVRVSREAMGSGIETGVQLAMPPGLVRGAVRAVPRLLGRAGKAAQTGEEVAGATRLADAGPLKPAAPPKWRPDLLEGKPTVRATTTPEGKTILKPATTQLRPAEDRFVRNLENELTGGPEKVASQGVQGPLRAPEAPQRGLAGKTREFFAPASSSSEAGETAAIVRTRLAEQARERAVSAELFRGVERTLDRLPDEQRLDVIRRMEHGEAQATPELNAVAESLQKPMKEKWVEVVRHNPKAADDYIENYFPHLWQDEQTARTVYGVKRGTVEGSKGFLKEREFPTVDVGIKAGYKLKDTNPARLAVQRMNDMDRYLMGQLIIEDLKAQGLAMSFTDIEVIPPGWQRMPGTIPNSSGLYVPQDAAMILDRYLTPGLSGAKLYDTVRSVGNSLNQAQLSLSGFHLLFTSLDAMTSRVALGFKELAVPGMRLKGIKDVGLGFSPTTALTTATRGNNVLKAYLRKPGFEQFNDLADAVVKAGGRATMDPFYRTGPLGGLKQLDQTMLGQFSHRMREMSGKLSAGTKALASGHVPTASKEVVGAVSEAMNALTDATSYPILQYVVPRQKLGVFSRMAEFEIAKLGPKATEMEVTQALQRAWDSVDNRMGQLVYDNLFWNKVFKDLMMLATRSVGWNVGTAREIGGGIGEYGKALVGRQKEFTHKMAYTASFPMVAGLYGAITQYLMTGKGPTELKDYFAPRTGKVFPDGRPERMVLASYMRDVLAATKGVGPSPMAPIKVTENLFEMGKHKVHPLWQSMFEMMTNEDFYGAAIRDPKDPEAKQMMDTLIFLAEQWTPLGMRQITGLGQMPAKPGFERSYPGLSLVGITPAPAAIERSAEQQAAVQQKIDRMKLARKKQREGVK